MRKAEELVAAVREQIGPDVALMLDCWMALDVDYTVRLAETLRPYRLRWIEDYLLPDDTEGFAQVRQRLPWQTLATGEHWYMPQSFARAANQRSVDIGSRIRYGLAGYRRVCASVISRRGLGLR